MRPGRTFSSADTRPAGHVFFIPPAARLDDDVKTRPHFLVNRCDPEADPRALGTLAHMSTRATEADVFGCAAYALRGGSSHVIAARLLPWPARAMERSSYSATDEVRSVRAAVSHALGMDTGTAARTSGSVRGRLARIIEPKAEATFAVVLTAPDYGSRRRYQLLAPILDRVIASPDGVEELELLAWDVIPRRHAWTDRLPFAKPVLDTSALLTLTEEWRLSRDSRTWLRKQIEVTDAVIDPETLGEVEAKIRERLEL
ncbi:MAG TPA: hypothetical protein VJT67_08410 [Longimicrobiaceae bacterium]|nr:hypothetical protein [Longimicrobiaceae bacterium]